MNKSSSVERGAQADSASLIAQLQSFVGKGGDVYIPSRDTVTQEAIARIVECAGDRNPVYRDAEFAASSVHGAIVAPPSSFMSFRQKVFAPVRSSNWTDNDGVHHFRLDPRPNRGSDFLDSCWGSERDYFLDIVPGVLKEAGYTSLAGTGGELRIKRYPRVGEQLSFSTAKILSIAGPKNTAAGEGYFTNSVYNVKDQNDEILAEVYASRLDFAPTAEGAAPRTKKAAVSAASAASLRPSIGSAVPLTIEDVSVGQEMPSLVVGVTSSLIIAGALFSGDTMDVHHDRDASIRRGFKDYFMNTMTTTSLVSRFVSDWAGPEAIIEQFGWRLGAPAYINDNLYLTGKVMEIQPDGERGRVTVAVAANNSLGAHATCNLRLLLPIASTSNAPNVWPEVRDANLARDHH
jgi:acyl dehydratase